VKKPSLIDKLLAMADPARNPNEHERAVAAVKLAAAVKARDAKPAGGSTTWHAPGTPVTAAAYARAHGIDPKKFRKQLRAAGKHAPYTLADLESVT
jgi:hypothetical protein